VTDRQTDGRTDRRTELRWLRRAIAVPAVARKNYNYGTKITTNKPQSLQCMDNALGNTNNYNN